MKYRGCSASPSGNFLLEEEKEQQQQQEKEEEEVVQVLVVEEEVSQMTAPRPSPSFLLLSSRLLLGRCRL
jgi:hypothetical protein